MPNGKGFIDCHYCVFAESAQATSLEFGEAGRCRLHQNHLPTPSELGQHRFCSHFQANELWHADQGGWQVFFTVLQQVARFGAELEPGVLYEYHVQLPDTLRPRCVLRVPDFDRFTWKEA